MFIIYLHNIKFNQKNLYVFVSQSGETADTAAALQLCKDNKVKTCSVVNVVESTIARNSDWVLPLHAGPEVGVASTKAFLGQMLILYILCLKIAFNRDELKKEKNYLIAFDTAYKKVLTTILDSNVTTLIAAFVLYYMGSGPVKGFAITLGLSLIHI